jgi:2-deoxy-D-gluconate 3-dehydrogenase
LTRALAVEWAASGITVNCLLPGFFETDMTQVLTSDPALHQSVAARTPLGRWGQPEDLDGAIVFLASRASAFVTGTALTVDGGWTAQ